MKTSLFVFSFFLVQWGMAGNGIQAASFRAEEQPPDSFLEGLAGPAFTDSEERDGQTVTLPLNGYVSVWSQDCSSEPCAIPLPLLTNRTIAFELSLPQYPGQARHIAVKEIFSLPEEKELSLKLDFYALCPYAAAKSSVADSVRGPRQASVTVADSAIGSCPALYFQSQAELSGAAGAFCAAAFNENDFTPFPVLMCAGARTRGIRFGITLHRQQLKKQ
ncbi:MAG TPA: hypothetical protein DCL44_02230 [Elusimicrobia bacterium]|nr:hypothetical protein [Elusimicrobiota bacterium]